MSNQMPESMKRSNLRFALTLPLFFMVMFPLCYVTALHLPSPHDIPVAVAGAGAAAFVAKVGPALAGKVDLIPVGSPGQAQQMIADQTAKAAYIPAPSGQSAHMLIAGADGRLNSQLLPMIFRPIASQSGNGLQVRDIAPLAPGDGNGIGLMFFMLICVLVGFMTANILGNAAFFLRLRDRLLISAGIAVLAPVVLYLFMGPWLQIIVGSPGQIVATIAAGAVASFTTGMITHAAVVFLGKWALFPAMLLFVFLNIPSSNSAYPAEIVPPVFDWISQWHLGAAMVNTVRSVLYLDGAGLTRPLVTMAVWLVVGVLAVGAAAAYRRHKAKVEAAEQAEQATATTGAAEELADEEARNEAGAAAAGAGPAAPALCGLVRDHTGAPLPDATVTVFDPAGAQAGHTRAGDDGRFRVDDVDRGTYIVVAAAPGHEPSAQHTILDGGHENPEVSTSFRLARRSAERGHSAPRTATVG